MKANICQTGGSASTGCPSEKGSLSDRPPGTFYLRQELSQLPYNSYNSPYPSSLVGFQSTKSTNANVSQISHTSHVHAFHLKEEIRRRYGQFEDILKAMEEQEGGIKKFALGHKTFGPQVDLVDYLLSRKIFLVKFSSFQISDDGTITWLEWAPAAQ